MRNFFSFISDDIFTAPRPLAFISLILVAVAMTAILSARFYLDSNIVENGISKKQIVAKKNFDVVDVKKTELLRKEVANKIRPIVTIVEENYIKGSLAALFQTVEKIRSSNEGYDAKYHEFIALLDIADPKKERYLATYLLNSGSENLVNLEQNSTIILKEFLKAGIAEPDLEDNAIEKIVTDAQYANIPRSQVKAISGILEHVVIPNLIIDEYATDLAKKNARSLVKPYTVAFNKGDVIVNVGEPVTQLKLDALKKSGFSVMELNKMSVSGIFLLCCLSIVFLLVYIKKYERKYLKFNYMAFIAVFSIILMYLTVTISPSGFIPSYIIPVPAFAILISIFTSPVIAFLTTILLLMLFLITVSLDPQLTAIYAFTALMSCYTIAKVNYSKRFDLIRCGFEAGAMMFLTTAVIALFENQLMGYAFLQNASFGLLNGFLSGIIALGMLPMAEYLFKIMTPYGLIELADHNQELLSKLQYKAPGTYHHSLMVANLCEAAAEAIGGNPILARVGAFYHDIGKLKRPLFFIENQSYFGIENPHTKLNPRLSKMVITSHTKDGMELAKEHRLPEAVINFIQQHHGEGLAGHFYNQAIEQEGAENVEEEQFRYPGPKPDTKETAILMLADAIESAVRSLKNPSQEEIENMINKIITERLNDGQLSDSPLTLKDIKIIAKTFNRILRGMQHDRIKYHENILNELEKNKIKINDSAEEKLEKKIQKKQQKHDQQNN